MCSVWKERDCSCSMGGCECVTECDAGTHKSSNSNSFALLHDQFMFTIVKSLLSMLVSFFRSRVRGTITGYPSYYDVTCLGPSL